jgi:deazaflavin-dependent oxidoreductase (nitroreductase family)
VATRPSPPLRALFRVPARLYQWRCGWLLGHRFLLLIHRGRRSGRRRQTVLEVVEYRTNGPEIVVVSAYGRAADWLCNVQATQEAKIVIGRNHFAAAHRILGEQEAVRVIKDYEHRNRFIGPIIRLGFSRFLGWRYRSTDSDRRRLVAQLPLIAFRPLS